MARRGGGGEGREGDTPLSAPVWEAADACNLIPHPTLE